MAWWPFSPPRPVVSVVIASYNHGRHVAACVASALDQGLDGLEVVITDDGSSDDTVAQIQALADARIRLKAFPANRGACAAMNDAIRRSRGEFIAVLNSDDVFLPGKLQRQVALLRQRPELAAVFAWPRFIDEQGRPFDDPSHKDHSVFHVNHPDRFAWLRHFFDHGNALCHPTAMVRRSAYERVGLYDQRLAQVPDLDMWIRMCTRFEIGVEPIASTGFRIRDGLQNASAARPEVVVRDAWERAHILRHYPGLPSADFSRVFPEFDASTETVSQFLGRHALALGHPFYQRFALDLLFNALPANDGPLLPWRRKVTGAAAAASAQNPARWRELHALTGRHDLHRLFPPGDLSRHAD